MVTGTWWNTCLLYWGGGTKTKLHQNIILQVAVVAHLSQNTHYSYQHLCVKASYLKCLSILFHNFHVAEFGSGTSCLQLWLVWCSPELQEIPYNDYVTGSETCQDHCMEIFWCWSTNVHNGNSLTSIFYFLIMYMVIISYRHNTRGYSFSENYDSGL